MNINTANFRHLDLLRRGSIVGKLSCGKEANIARVSGAKTSKEILGFSVSISEESKTMLEQLKDEKKNRELDSPSENKSSTIDSSNVNNVNNVKMLEATLSFGSDKYRLVHAAYQCDDPKKAGTLSFDSLASTYTEMCKEFASQYTGEELEGHLNTLNADYEDAVAYITNSVKQAIQFFAAKDGKEGERKAIEASFGMNMKDLNDMRSKMGIAENQPFIDSIDAFIKVLAQASRTKAAKEFSLL